MPDATEVIKELEGLLQIMKGKKLRDESVNALKAAKATFEEILDRNAILRRDLPIKKPLKLKQRGKP